MINKHISKRNSMLAMSLIFTLASIGGRTAFAADVEVFKAQKPIRMIVPFPAGGGADIAARVTAKAAGDRFGQPIIVENKAGAGGSVGSEFVSRAAPDGYTIEMASGDTHSIYPHVYVNNKFRASEFRGVSPVARMGFVLVGKPGLEAKTIPELIALAKKRQLSFSSYGAGNSSSLAMASFIKTANLPEFLHVPYQGAAPASQALIAGEVDLMVMPLPIAKAQPRAIQFGVLSSERSKLLPNLPTMKEQKIDLVTDVWVGILAPPGTPSAIVESLAKGFTEAMGDPAVAKSIEDIGMEPFSLTPTAYQDYLQKESVKWGNIAKDANVRLD